MPSTSSPALSQQRTAIAGKASTGKEDPRLLYLQGLIAWKQGQATQGALLLEKALWKQLEASGTVPPGLPRFTTLDPGRVMDGVRLLMGSMGGEPRSSTDSPSPLLGRCIR